MTPWRLLTVWRFDTFTGVAALALAAVYLYGGHGGCAGAVTAGRWQDSVTWSPAAQSFALPPASGVRSYGSAMFSVHMVEHMTLNMFVLVLLGAPVTLALRVLPSAAPGAPPGPREWIVRAVHSPFTAFLSNPITAFMLFVGSLYVVYFTPLFDTWCATTGATSSWPCTS